MLTSDHLAEIADAAELSRVQSWVDDLTFILNSRPQKNAVALIASRRGCSTSSIHQKLRALRQRGPLALADGRVRRKSLAPALYGHRSPAFIQWVHSLYYQCQRSQATPTVYGLMLQRLHAWRHDPLNPDLAIPGYDTPPLDTAESGYQHPRGWSQRQLNAIKPDDYNLALGRKGRHAANLLLPPVLTSRVGLHPGEVYLFDDQYYDLLVHYGSKIVRPVGLNALDLFSGCDVARGIRPELPDNPEGEKSLTRQDLVWLIVSLLTHHGYYRDRCVLTVESGSATIDAEFESTLALVSDRKISVQVGFPTRELVKGVLTPSRGNPRFKAARESWFNLLRNRMAALPMALGRNYEDKPEDTDRVASEERHLLALRDHLPPAAFDDLQLETLPWSRFFLLANHISEAINRRTDHDLEGYAALGLERIQWRYRGEWLDEGEYKALPCHARESIVNAMHQGEIVTRPVKCSPREVYDAGRRDLVKISPFRWHLLIPRSLALPRTIPADRQLVIKAKAYGPEPIVLQSVYHTEDGDQKALPAGKDVLVFLSPHQPDAALLTDPHGRVLGLCFALQKSHRLDTDALLAQYAQRATIKAQIGTSAETYNQTVATERQKKRQANQLLLQTHGIKPTRKAAHPKRVQPPTKPSSKPKKTVTPPIQTQAEEAGEGIGIL